METRTFLIMDTSGEDGYNHDYDVTMELTDAGTVYTMYYSRNHYWDERLRGQKIMTVIDDGNGYVISPRPGKNLDYAEAAELFAMLSFISSQERLGLYKGDIIETNLIKSI